MPSDCLDCLKQHFQIVLLDNGDIRKGVALTEPMEQAHETKRLPGFCRRLRLSYSFLGMIWVQGRGYSKCETKKKR